MLSCKLILVLGILASFVHATWIWDPNTGWVNTKYDPQETAKILYRQATQLQSQGQYRDAAPIFQSIVTIYPNTPEAHKSVYEGAQCHYLAENYYDAYLLYEEYLRRNPRSDRTNDILEKEYEIGTILIYGKVKPQTLLDFTVQSSGQEGVEILQKLVETSPYANFSDDAQLLIANYYFKLEEYRTAQEHYQKVVKDYPKSELAGFAQYQMAVCSRYEFRGLPYDARYLDQSQQHLDEYFKKFPRDSNMAQAQKYRQENLEMLAMREWNIAQFYLRHDEIPAARIYLVCLIEKYPQTKVADNARALLQQLPQ